MTDKMKNDSLSTASNSFQQKFENMDYSSKEAGEIGSRPNMVLPRPVILGNRKELYPALLDFSESDNTDVDSKTYVTPTEYHDGYNTYRLDDIYFDRDDENDLIMKTNIDGEWVESNDDLGNILISIAGFCGCACPDDAMNFFLTQLRDFKEGKNYFNMPGGLDYFKICCYELGIFDKEFNLTDKGLFLTGLANKIPDLKTQGPGLVKQVKIEFKSDAAKAEILSLMTDRLNNELPDNIDKDQLLNLIYFYVSRLADRQPPNSPESLYAYRESNPGECTLTLYWLENVFELEEHGGSTPGWLAYDQEFKWDIFKEGLM